MKIDRSLPIAQLAAELPGAISVFEALGIDYATAGNRPLDDAAHAEGIDPEVVVAALRRLHEVEPTELWSDRPLTDLVRHLVTQHHHFLRGELSKLALRLADVCSSPSGVETELLSLRATFVRLSAILLPHLHREEEDVFRRLETLEHAWQSKEPSAQSSAEFGDHIRELIVDHGAIAAQLHTMRGQRQQLEQRNELAPRSRAILADLATLEAHLHEYMFLENSVLFPRALQLEGSTLCPAG